MKFKISNASPLPKYVVFRLPCTDAVWDEQANSWLVELETLQDLLDLSLEVSEQLVIEAVPGEVPSIVVYDAPLE